jgi:hypothetical protein
MSRPYFSVIVGMLALATAVGLLGCGRAAGSFCKNCSRDMPSSSAPDGALVDTVDAATESAAPDTSDDAGVTGTPGAGASDSGPDGCDWSMESAFFRPPNPCGCCPAEACAADLQNDPHNCGACGHDCLQAPCVAGVCGTAPTVLASQQSPTFVAVDATNVYWANSKPPPGGAVADSQLLRCAITGCNDQPATLWSGLYSVDDLAVQQGSLWWSTFVGPIGSGDASSSHASPQVLSCPISGCGNTATSLVTSPGVLSPFATDDTNAYWANIDVQSCALTGCGNTPTILATDSSFTLGLGVGPRGVYWSNENGQLQACPKSGCIGTPAVLGPIDGATRLITADANNVYWIEPGTPNGVRKEPITQWFNGSVRLCPVTGCNGSPTVLATYPSWLGGGAIAVDATDVYWTTEDGSGTYGEVVRCNIQGCGGKPIPIATTATKSRPTLGLALDATSVYWSDPGFGAVLMRSK